MLQLVAVVSRRRSGRRNGQELGPRRGPPGRRAPLGFSLGFSPQRWRQVRGHEGTLRHRNTSESVYLIIEAAVPPSAARGRAAAVTRVATPLRPDVSSRLFPASRSRADQSDRASRRTPGRRGPVRLPDRPCEEDFLSFPPHFGFSPPEKVILFETFHFLPSFFMSICDGL